MEDEIKKLNNQILELQRYLDEKRDRMVQGNGGVGNQNIHFQ
jgi:peptidoglycan hydrolase CwlO-like protein